MAYNSSSGFSDTQDNQKSFNEKFIDNDPGPYLATVKVTNDPLRMGRLGVNIPAITLTTNPKPSQIIWCQYLSPFYGAKSINAVSKTDPYDYKETQHSYGMWAVPPDIDSEVLVIFAKGEQSNSSAFWIGCVQQPLVNQQVPANGATENSRIGAQGTDFGQTKQQAYGTDFLPAGEKNQRTYETGDTVTLSNASQWKYPVNDVLADQLNAQGLVKDDVRGTTSSSARRESPSKVFGINTPGALRDDSRSLNIGLNNSAVKTDRNPGHSFVMDDGDVFGQNQLTRIRTASGHQLLMHDTEGVVYLANGSGKAFIEMDADGTVSVFAEGGINIRSSGDFNLHSELDINFHAKGRINLTSETNLALNAEGYLYAMGEKGVLSSSQKGSVRHFGRDGISSYTPGTQLHGAAGRIDLAGSQVHFNSVAARAQWGPTWLKPDSDQVGIKVTKGFIDVDSEKPITSGETNTIDNKTTVTEFVTHEPYTRQSSTALRKRYINDVMAEIAESSPELTPTELKVIKSELLNAKSVPAVSEKLTKLVKLNKSIKLPTDKLKDLAGKALEIQQLIENPKDDALNFVHGKIEDYKGQATTAAKSLADKAIDNVKKFFRF